MLSALVLHSAWRMIFVQYHQARSVAVLNIIIMVVSCFIFLNVTCAFRVAGSADGHHIIKVPKRNRAN